MAILGGEPTCPIAHGLEVLGDRWTLLVMRNALRGATRFSEFQSALGIPRDILAARLATLVAGGALAKQGYRAPGERSRDEYVVTDAGRELLVILSALGEWGARHTAIDGEVSIRFADAETGETVGARLVTAAGRVVDARDVVAVAR